MLYPQQLKHIFVPNKRMIEQSKRSKMKRRQEEQKQTKTDCVQSGAQNICSRIE